jgi:hypothetical protein
MQLFAAIFFCRAPLVIFIFKRYNLNLMRVLGSSIKNVKKTSRAQDGAKAVFIQNLSFNL